MNILEILGATTIGIIVAVEFLAAIGIGITLYKIYGVSRRFNSTTVHHHHHYNEPRHDHDVDTHDELVADGYDDDEDEDAQEVPSQERPF